MDTKHRSQWPRIMVLGNQKSGTTAISKLLAEHTGLTISTDIPQMWSHELSFHSTPGNLARFVSVHSNLLSKEIIKEPMLTFLYHELRPIFPKAAYLFVVRHPTENIRSILDRLQLPGDLQVLPRDVLNNLSSGWRHVLEGSILGGDQGGYIANLAFRWVKAVRTWREDSERIHLLKYEKFNANKAETVYEIAAKLGFSPKRDINSLLDFQFQRLGSNRGIPLEQFFGAYNLEVIYRICEMQMKELGYQQ